PPGSATPAAGPGASAPAGSSAASRGAAEAPAPQPSAAVQKLFDAANPLTRAHQFADALKRLDQALAAAREGKDTVGEARALRGRAITPAHLNRTVEAARAWQDAARAWAQAGEGPGCDS
ncbi:MAG: hypothetical protein ACRDQZ_11205, partial [Mycobacteriales bacterium]